MKKKQQHQFKLNKTARPSGIFRQPRQDYLQESVSQCVVNKDSLCKVSDFEVSLDSKYNLPELYNVDGMGRAIYWLYKHSLADGESVRNCKTKSLGTTETSMITSTGTYTNTTIIKGDGAIPRSAIVKCAKAKMQLCKIRRGIFISSTSSDIEIKETYNSYLNLNDLETADLLLKRNERLSVDKYDNLMKNLQFRKRNLEKKKAQIESDKNKAKSELQSDNYRLEKFLKRNNDNRFKRKKDHRKHKTTPTTESLINSEIECITRTGLEVNNLDHILNQMKFFLESGKSDEITETQKTELENYLRVLTEDTERAMLKREIYKGSMRRNLKDNIKSSLRDIMYTTEKHQTSSVIVEAGSKPSNEIPSTVTSAQPLKQSAAQPDLARKDLSISPAILEIAKQGSSYNSFQSDLTDNFLENEIKCEDLQKDSAIRKPITKTDSTDRLIYKQYRLDETDELVNFGCAKESYERRKKTKHKKENIDMGKFNSIRSFDEADTFKSLQHKQKTLTPQISEENICIMETISSCNEDLNNIMGEKISKEKVEVRIDSKIKEKVEDITLTSSGNSNKEKDYKNHKKKSKKPHALKMDANSFNKNEKSDQDKSHKKHKIENGSLNVNAKDVEDKKKKSKNTNSNSSNKSNECDVDLRKRKKSVAYILEFEKETVGKKTLHRTDSILSNKSNKSTEHETDVGDKDAKRREEKSSKNIKTMKMIEKPKHFEEGKEVSYKKNTEKYRVHRKHKKLSSIDTKEHKVDRKSEDDYNARKIQKKLGGVNANRAGDQDNYACFKDQPVSSDSGNDLSFENSFYANLKVNKNIKSYSYPKAKKTPIEKVCREHLYKGIESRKNKERSKVIDENKVCQSENCIESPIEKARREYKYNVNDKIPELDCKPKVEGRFKHKDVVVKDNNEKKDYKLFLNIDSKDKGNIKITSISEEFPPEENVIQTSFFREDSTISISDVKRNYDPSSYRLGTIGQCIESLSPPLITTLDYESQSNNHIIKINESLIQIDGEGAHKTSENHESMIDYLSNLHKSLKRHGVSSGSFEDIPVYKQGVEIARITRKTPSCAYTINKYSEKLNKSTQMFEHVTQNDLYTLQWIHDNLFEININPHTLIVDEKIKEVSEITDVSL